MIILPYAVLSSPAAATSFDYPRICYQTYTRGLSGSDIVASSEDVDAPKDAPLRPDTWEFWRPTALPATWEVSFDGIKEIDYVGIAGHDFGSRQCSVKVESNLGGAYTTLSELVPADDTTLLFLQSTTLRANGVRITLDGDGSRGMPSMAVVYAGQQLVMQRTIYGGHAPMTMARQTVLTQSLSQGGQFLGQSFVSHGLVGKASFRFLTADWVRANLDAFIKEARRYPFFFAWRPSTFPLEVAYAWATSDIQPNNMGKKNFMQVDIPMRALGNA